MRVAVAVVAVAAVLQEIEIAAGWDEQQEAEPAAASLRETG